jgi:hypothetical protein
VEGEEDPDDGEHDTTSANAAPEKQGSPAVPAVAATPKPATKVPKPRKSI